MSGLEENLGDLYYFTLVAQHGGYTAASRITGIAKNKLSRRVTALEEHLGIRLFQRTNRQVSLTETGFRLMEHGLAILSETEAAQTMISRSLSEPAGLVRISCPSLATRLLLSGCITECMTRYPKIDIQVQATDRRCDPVSELIDIAIRLRERKYMEQGFIARELGKSVRILVATPEYLAANGNPGSLIELCDHPLITLIAHEHEQPWEFTDTENNIAVIHPKPHLSCSEWDIVQHVTYSHQGIALLPDMVCGDALRAGKLIRVLPQWHRQPLIVHMVYPSRQGMLPAVRVMIDLLAERVPALLLEGI